ncbi:MAG: hypothetical protein GXO74_03175 [Calditrichaeota bacterium]|nr:hypothetical protein [Calditrichota bacterium]
MDIRAFEQILRDAVFKKADPWAKLILLSQERDLFEKIKKQTLEHENILLLKARLQDEITGIPSLDNSPADFRQANTFYWILRFFSDLQLSAKELGIEKLIHRLKLNQTESGQFILNYNKQKRQSIELVCMTAHLTDCLIGLGEKNSRTVTAGVRYLFSTQRPDGSWHCDSNRFPGEKNEYHSGCPAATLFALRALSHFPEHSRLQIKKATHFAKKSLENIKFDCPWAGSEKAHFEKLRYPPPFSGLDILNVIDTLSLVAKVERAPLLIHLVEKISHHLSPAGLLISDKRIPAWRQFDFAHNKRESSWLTALLARALNRIV